MSPNTYRTQSGVLLRVVGNNLLVRMNDRPKKTRGGILIPDTAFGSAHGTGQVLAVGNLTGKRAPQGTPIPDVRPGNHVLFVRLLERTDSNPQLKVRLEEDVVRIRPDDVLLVLDAEDVERVE